MKTVVTAKVCARCKEEKPASAFNLDSHRTDGLKSYCVSCVKNYQPKGTRRNLKGAFKVCIGCKRNLPGDKFLFAQTPDGLRDDCRTCRSHRKGYPTTTEAVDFEASMKAVFTEAIIQLLSLYPPCDESDLLSYHRSEFEQIVQRIMQQTGLLKNWKTPIWLHETSLPDYEVK